MTEKNDRCKTPFPMIFVSRFYYLNLFNIFGILVDEHPSWESTESPSTNHYPGMSEFRTLLN